jgi:hypothetical protein
MKRLRTGVLLMTFAAILTAGPLPAQPTAARSRPPELNTLALEPGIAPVGRMGGFTGTVDATGHRIVAESLSVVQPVRVAVVASDPSRPVRASLHKGSWDEPLRSGVTDDQGHLVFDTRTEGNMGILIRSADDRPAAYQMAMWVGDEMPSQPASIFRKSRTAARNGGGAASGGSGAGAPEAAVSDRASSTGTLTWLGGGAVLAIVLAGAFVMRRRSRAGKQAALVIGLLAMPLAAHAQLGPQPKPTKLGTEALKEMLEKSLVDNTKKGFEELTNPKNWDPEKWKDAFDTLSPDDKGYDEDYDPPGMPELPLECDLSEKCATCFEPAYERLTKVRIRFEKLRRVYAWTKAYKERAFALGDSAAGIHGLAGLAWVGKRIGLEKSYKRFEAAYDDKYEELLQELRASLEQIAECEAEIYGEKDWYNRFGFIYYQFMADRHRRS